MAVALLVRSAMKINPRSFAERWCSMSTLPLTDRARKIMKLACQEAGRFGHDRVNTGHLLLGLIHEGNGIAALVLKSLGVHFDEARRELEILLSATTSNRIAFDEPVRAAGVEKVLRYSEKEALDLNHRYLGSEHLLLGLAHDGEGGAAQVLRKLGVELPAARAAVVGILGVPATPETRQQPLRRHMIADAIGRATLGLCAILSSLALGAYVVVAIIKLATVGPPPVVWKAVLFHLVLDLCAFTSIFMLFVSVSSFAGGCRWIDPLLHRMMPKAIVAVLALVTVILVVAIVALPETGILCAILGVACLVSVVMNVADCRIGKPPMR